MIPIIVVVVVVIVIVIVIVIEKLVSDIDYDYDNDNRSAVASLTTTGFFRPTRLKDSMALFHWQETTSGGGAAPR